jgi:murein DD-endopeptidase MepM/ murein hydrolase activator NlpD
VIDFVKTKRLIFPFLCALFLLSGCYKPGPGAKTWQVSGVEGGSGGGNDQIIGTPTSTAISSKSAQERINTPTLHPSIPTPTPNPPITMPTPRQKTLDYVVKEGDTLGKIARAFQVTVNRLIILNEIYNADQIEVGQVLIIPPPTYDDVASNFKIIPDSELVNSPSNASFDVTAFVQQKNGYLSSYFQEVDGITLSGADVVSRIALEYSINPRLLLTLLEWQSSWVTNPNPDEETLYYPMKIYEIGSEGLYQQLSYTSNLLNEGYYLWKINAIGAWNLRDNTILQAEPTINPGTAGVLNLMQYLANAEEWERAISDGGIFTLYSSFFGYPFVYAYEPIIPVDLAQPTLQLPFEVGDIWSFTGGPHGGWNSGSAWAALDFAPPGEALGCFPSNAWVVASAAGEIVYSDHGAVIQDLDGDGIWQTSWSILYMHIDSWERVDVGTYLEAGDRIGHPSCEGGFSTGTHLHIARRYNGEWIAADGELPFVMDGWVSSGYGVEYNGFLTKGNQTLEAWNGRSSLNAIER